MREYSTQMEAAKKGIITPEMEIVAAKENIDADELRELMAKGQVVIPANINHKSLSPEGIGKGLKTKINVNLGISGDMKDYDMEMEKLKWLLISVVKPLWTLAITVKLILSEMNLLRFRQQ